MYASCFHFLSKGPKILVFISSGVCLLQLFIFEDKDNLLYIFLTSSRSLDSKGSGPPFFQYLSNIKSSEVAWSLSNLSLFLP